MGIQAALLSIRYIDHDEVEHLHTTWHLISGHQPYKDFFQHHNPLLWYMLAPIMMFTGESLAIIFIARSIMFIATIAVLFLIKRLSMQLLPAVNPWLAPFLAATTILFQMKSLEIRPDIVEILLSLLMLTAIIDAVQGQQSEKQTLGRKRIFIAGLLGGAAFLFVQKAVFYIVPAVMMLCFMARPTKTKISALFAFAMGVALPLTVMIISATIQGFSSEYLALAYQLNFYLSRSARFMEIFMRMLLQNLGLIGGMIFGIPALLKGERRVHLSLLVIPQLLLFAVTRPNAEQDVVQILPGLIMLAAAGWNTIISKGESLSRYPLRKAMTTAIIVFLILLIPLLFQLRMFFATNGEQREAMQYVIDNTSPNDYMYDGNTEVNVFRNDVDYFWFSPDGKKAFVKMNPNYKDSLLENVNTLHPQFITDFRLNVLSLNSTKGSYQPTPYRPAQRRILYRWIPQEEDKKGQTA